MPQALSINKLEVPVKEIAAGRALGQGRQRGVGDNPDVLRRYEHFASERSAQPT